jgi:hypothetical protein
VTDAILTRRFVFKPQLSLAPAVLPELFSTLARLTGIGVLFKRTDDVFGIGGIRLLVEAFGGVGRLVRRCLENRPSP